MKKLEKIEEIAKGVSIIKFYADWCGPCRAFAPIMESVANNVDNAKFFSVNTDERRDIAEHFSISSLPSVVIIKDGKVVERFMGIKNAKEITGLINQYKN
jgi:thioredoxin 1